MSYRLAVLVASCALSGCAGGFGSKTTPLPAGEFAGVSPYARTFAAPDADTCEAGRRALLSQGYVVIATGRDLVVGRKNFQPQPETHVQVEFRIVCAAEPAGGTVAFASALQDRYTLKKSNNSASLGVSALGSVSLPFMSSDEALVRVASQTVVEAGFYDRFFTLLGHYLPPPRLAAVVAASAPSPLPPPASLPPPPLPPLPVPPLPIPPTGVP